MTNRRDRDLFGQEIPEATLPLTRWLQKRDAATFEMRRARALFLKGVRPNYGYLMPLESHVVLQEAEESFLHGSDVATVIPLVTACLAGSLRTC